MHFDRLEENANAAGVVLTQKTRTALRPPWLA
jgi:hypothetical protein